jgi:hypothetical protein
LLAWNDVTLLPPMGLVPGGVAEMAVSASPLPMPGRYQVDIEIPTRRWKITSVDSVTVTP